MSVDWIIFSRDRACQLDALLRSQRRASHLTRSLTVLYRSSSDEHERAYRLCERRYGSLVLFEREQHDRQGFEPQLHRWLRSAGPTVGFLCDDDLWWRTPPAFTSLRLPFSTRLGGNCVVQHPTGGRPQKVPAQLQLQADGVGGWQWLGCEGDFGYPFSLDGDIRDRDQTRRLLERFGFSDPTTLEAGAATSAVEEPGLVGDWLYAGRTSSLVGVPQNRVTVNSHNPVMAGGRSPAELARLYLAGARIHPARTIAAYGEPEAAHCEIPYLLTADRVMAGLQSV